MAKQQKKMKGQPELYDEVGIIPVHVEGVHQLDAERSGSRRSIANSLSRSPSEMVDKIAQGIIKLQVDDEQLKSA